MADPNSEEKETNSSPKTDKLYIPAESEQHIFSGKYVVVNFITETQKNPHINTEQLIERYENRNESFVETAGFKEAKYFLEKKHLVMITGLPGDGKSSVAIQLLLTFKDSHEIVKLHSIQQFSEKLNRARYQIFLLDDVLGKSGLEKGNLGTIERAIEDIKKIVDGKTLVVMSSETSILKEAQSRVKIDISANIVDLSKEFKLSKPERIEILQKYITSNNVAKYIGNKHGDVNTFVTEVASLASEIGYPHCVAMFTNTELGLIDIGLNFFKFPFRHLNELINRLYRNNPCLYAFMLLLTLRKGRILEEDLAELFKDLPLITLLEETSVKPKEVRYGKFRGIINKYDGTYLKRFIEEGIVGFNHYSFMTAMRLHFAEKYRIEAISHLPFEFSYENFRTSVYLGKENVVKLEVKDYNCLAQKFASEVLSGNIQLICQHQACSDEEFAKRFSKQLLDYHAKKNCFSPFEIMERELEIKETFNGSILYWASVYKAEYLVAEILNTGVLQNAKNPLWIKLQTSATLVHACKHGFQKRIIESLLALGAEILCQHHIGKEYDTKFCDTCNVFSETGCSPLQAVLMNERTSKHQTLILELLLNVLSDKIKNSLEMKLIIRKALREAVLITNESAFELLFKWVDFDINIEKGRSAGDKKERSILWHAVCCQSRNLIHKCLPIGNIPEERHESGKTILMMAKDVETMKCLIEHGVSINVKDHYGRNVLFFSPDADVAKFLIDEMKLKVNEKDDQGMTPLHVLLHENDENKADVLSTLLLHGADVFARNFENRFPLQLAQNAKFSELICRQLAEEEDDSKYFDIKSMVVSTFETVTEANVLQTIMSHLKQFKNDYTIDLNQSMLFHAKSGLLTGELLSFYMKENISLSISDVTGNVLHHLCTISDDELLTNILEEMEHGRIEVNGVDQEGNTPLHIACKLDENDITLRTRTTIINFLFANGANVNAKNKSCETPLHLLLKTVCEGTSDILDLLLSRNVDINVQSLSGSTPLQLLIDFEVSSQLHHHEANVCIEKLLNDGVTIEVQSLASSLFASCGARVRLFETLVRNMNKLDETGILQILEHCFAAPDNVDSWEILQILKSENVIKVFPNTCGESDVGTSVLCVTPDTIKFFSNKLKIDCDIIKMMLGIEDIENKETVDKYFQNGIRFGSKCAIDLIQKEGGSYFIRFIHYIISSNQARQRHNLASYVEGAKSEVRTIRHLLEYDIDIIKRDNDGHSALYYIVSSNMPDEIADEYAKILIQNGADVDDGFLLVAAANKTPRAKVLETLVSNCEDKQICDDQGRNVIFLLVDNFITHYTSMGDISSSIRHLHKHGVDMNKKNNVNETVLQLSVQCFTKFDSAHVLFHTDFVNVLLECEADPNIVDETSGQTSLHKAVMYNIYRETDLVRLLISKGGNINATDNLGRGLLHCAVLRMNHDSVKTTLYLLSIGLDVNAQDNHGNTALHLLVQRCRPEDHVFGMNLESDHMWCSPLRISVMKCLLMGGADGNTTNKSGKTVLHIAVDQYKKYEDKQCHPKHLLIEMMAMLLSHDCDINIKDCEEKSAVDKAKEGSLNDIRKFLTRQIGAEELLFPKYSRARTRRECETTNDM